MDYQEVINALRDRTRKFVSLDTPKDSDLGDLAIDIGAGFVPVVGTATSARDFERARRENDKLGMALSSLGMIPVVGGVTAGVSKLRKGAKVADKVADASPALREVIEQAVAKADDVPEALALAMRLLRRWAFGSCLRSKVLAFTRTPQAWWKTTR